ncbi:MAG: metallophosphoesterase [Bacteroidota bacterium]
MILARIIFFLFILFIEWYFYQAILTSFRDSSELRKNIVKYSYFIIAGIMLTGAVISLFFPFQFWPRTMRVTLGSIMFIILLSQLIGIIFLIPDDIIRLFRFIYHKIFPSQEFQKGENSISRYKFFSYLSVAAAAIPGIGLLYGYFRGGYDYRIHKVKLNFPNLPEEFNGFRILQISDIHTGSFLSPAPLMKAFKLANEQNPDVIFFTGDLVNDLPEETEGFENAFKTLRATHGVYSIFGNHDYADYTYPGEENKSVRLQSQQKLKDVHSSIGWELLMNEHTYITKNNSKIGLIGVENWDAKGRFSKYGDLNKATNGMEQATFNILLSHSPSHWEAKVLPEFKNIDLTLSGHTHGMQFGIEIPGLKWSPVKYLYKQWAGLYRSENQYLYVNRGLGFIGYHGRLGIWPEITVIELFKGDHNYAET